MTTKRKLVLVGNIGRSTVDTGHSVVTIDNTVLRVIEFRGQRVVTLAQVDAVHQRPKGTARRNFNVNRGRLIAGEDFFEVAQADEIRSLGLERPQGGTSGKVVLLAEVGYLMLVKSFGDDLAWQVQRKLVTGYFRQHAPEAVQPPKVRYAVGRRDSLSLEQANKLRDTLEVAAKALPPNARGQFLKEGWSRLKAHYKCSYREIPASEFDEAVSLLTRHVLRYEVAPVAQQPAAIGYTPPDARAALVIATNALAQVVPVLVELAGQDAANEPMPAQRRHLRRVA